MPQKGLASPQGGGGVDLGSPKLHLSCLPPKKESQGSAPSPNRIFAGVGGDGLAVPWNHRTPVEDVLRSPTQPSQFHGTLMNADRFIDPSLSIGDCSWVSENSDHFWRGCPILFILGVNIQAGQSAQPTETSTFQP